MSCHASPNLAKSRVAPSRTAVNPDERPDTAPSKRRPSSQWPLLARARVAEWFAEWPCSELREAFGRPRPLTKTTAACSSTLARRIDDRRARRTPCGRLLVPRVARATRPIRATSDVRSPHHCSPQRPHPPRIVPRKCRSPWRKSTVGDATATSKGQHALLGEGGRSSLLTLLQKDDDP